VRARGVSIRARARARARARNERINTNDHKTTNPYPLHNYKQFPLQNPTEPPKNLQNKTLLHPSHYLTSLPPQHIRSLNVLLAHQSI